MRRPVFLTVLAALVAGGMVATAIAAGPTFRDRDTFSETDTNFCGTEQTVLVDGTVVANGWIGTTGGDPDQLLKLTLNLQITYTNPANGLAVIERWSELETNAIISGTEDAAHTHEFSNTGLKAMLKLADGRVLTRDAGSITYRVSFDADDNFTGVEVVSLHGPHPAFFADLFCPIMIDALGL